MKKLLFLLIPLLALFIACQEDDSNPAAPADEPQINISFIGMVDSIRAPEGVQRSVDFQVLVELGSVALSGKKVGLQVTFGSGYISTANDITDQHGSVNTHYYSTLSRGVEKVSILAVVDGRTARHEVTLIGTARPVNLTLRADQSVVVDPPNGIAEIKLDAVVTDSFSVGVPNTGLRFSLHPVEDDDEVVGSIDPVTQTSSSGIASTTFRSSGEYGSVKVRVALDEGMEFADMYAETVISVENSVAEGGNLYLSSTKDSIYADNGITSAGLRAQVTDDNHNYLMGETVLFTANYNGSVTSSAITDEHGVAEAVFTDIGLPSGYTDNQEFIRAPSMVIARCPRLRTADTLHIDIPPMRPINNIVLTAGASRMEAGSEDTTWVRAVVYLNPERTAFAPEGAQVLFHVDNPNYGAVLDEITRIEGDMGLASTSFVCGRLAGNAQITAFVGDEEVSPPKRDTVSDPWAIWVHPAQINHLTVTTDPPELFIGYPDRRARVEVRGYDAYDNLVSMGGIQIDISMSIGVVLVPFEVIDGVATAWIGPGMEAGFCEITLTIETPNGPISARTAVMINSGGGSQIELSAYPLRIWVSNGSMANSVSTLTAVVRDGFGNLVHTPTMVVFQLITGDQPPQSCNINNNLFDFRSDTTITANGIARASLNSGTKIGPQLIRAFTLYPDSSQTGVTATFSRVSVVGGAANNIDLAFGRNGENLGVGMWSLEISALVTDQYGSPAVDSIPIVFAVTPNIAAIQSSLTGSRSRAGRITPGVAYTELIYSGTHAFDTVTVWAYARTEEIDSVGESISFPLPFLGEGQLTLHTDPGNWQFDGDESDSSHIRVLAVLQDENGNTINNAPILFTTTRAHFFYRWRYVPTEAFRLFPGLVRRYTGPDNDGVNVQERQQDNDPDGETVVWLKGWQDEFFLDDMALETTVQINAELEGFENIRAEPISVTITRRR